MAKKEVVKAEKELVAVAEPLVIKIETNENDLKAFKKYLEEQIKVEGSKLQIGVSGIQYTYNMNLAIYTKNVDGSIIKSDINDAYWALTELCWWGMTSNYTQTHFEMYELWYDDNTLKIIYKIGDKHYRFDGDYVHDYTMIPIEVKKITRMVEQTDWIDVDTISVDDTEYFKEKALTSTKSLYKDISDNITLLLKGRSNKNKDVEGQALSEMERLMCSTLQQLDCLIDYINDYKN